MPFLMFKENNIIKNFGSYILCMWVIENKCICVWERETQREDR